MSGPKIVRIVTREEILEICRGELARVDAALAEWIRVGERNECVDDQAIATSRRRRDAVAALLEQERFLDVQKQAGVEEAFLRRDMQDRLAVVAAEQAAARGRARREREVGASLARSLRSAGAAVDGDLLAGLQYGSPDAITAGFRLLSTVSGANNAGSAADTLADKLRQPGGPRSYADWLRQRAGSADEADPAFSRLELRLSELEIVEAGEPLPSLRLRLQEAGAAEGARRLLILDSLEVEIARALTAARQLLDLRAEVDALDAQLAAAGLPPVPDTGGTSAADVLAAHLAAGRARLAGHRSRMAAAARREAVLKELATLGYEVTEGMTTTLADEGRLVVRSASRPDYGVEVAASAGGDRMQMRPVAFGEAGHGPDPARDVNAETIWCAEVTSLQQGLAEHGGELTIEKALAIGAVPLKRIASRSADEAVAAARPAPRQRTIK